MGMGAELDGAHPLDDGGRIMSPMRTAVIMTVFNEADSIDALLESLAAQTLAPAEIVVVDAGSTDGTIDKLESFASRDPRVRVVHRPGNRSVGRNAAIGAATAQVIACIDGGCVAEPDWLAKLVAPFEQGTDWVAGFYRAQGHSLLSTCIGLVMVYTADEVDPETFLPSGRSMAFTKEAWTASGGFPEDFDFAEDTLFDQRMLAAGFRPVFVRDAVVVWTPPSSLSTLATTLYRWGHGDGLAGLRGSIYRRMLVLFAGTAVAVAVATVLLPWLVPVALVPLAYDTYRKTRPKYRWADGLLKFVYIPAAHLVASVAAVAGFLVGRRQRRRTP